MKYTAEELVKRFAGKYINTYATYDYTKQKWFYEVRGTKSEVWENYNLPEDCIVND